MLKLVTLALLGLLLFSGGAPGQAVTVTTYSYPLPAVPVAEAPVATVTTYSAPVVTTRLPAAAVTSVPASVVTTYRQPLLRPRTTVVRTVPVPAVVLPAPTVVTYGYPGVLLP